MIGTTNVLNELNNKLTNNTSQSITCNILTSKSAVIQDNLPFYHVSSTVINNASNWYASVFAKSLNNNIEIGTMGMRVGNNSGASLITTTNTPLKFHTYTTDVDLTYNRPSIEINSSGSRDVTVYSPMLVKGYSTF